MVSDFFDSLRGVFLAIESYGSKGSTRGIDHEWGATSGAASQQKAKRDYVDRSQWGLWVHGGQLAPFGCARSGLRGLPARSLFSLGR